jgi:hypothetical protein
VKTVLSHNLHIEIEINTKELADGIQKVPAGIHNLMGGRVKK